MITLFLLIVSLFTSSFPLLFLLHQESFIGTIEDNNAASGIAETGTCFFLHASSSIRVTQLLQPNIFSQPIINRKY